MGIPPYPQGGCSSDWLFSCSIKKKSLPPQLVSAAQSLLHVASCKECLHPLWSTGTLWWGHKQALSSPGWRDLTPSVFPHKAGPPALWSSLWILSSLFRYFLNSRYQSWTQHSGCSLTSRVEWNDHTSVSAGNGPEEEVQDLICLHCCSSTMLTHVHHIVHQDPTGPFQKSCFLAAHILACTGLFGYAIPGAEPCTCLCQILYGSCLLPLPKEGSQFSSVHLNIQLSIITRPAKCTHNSIIQITSKDLESWGPLSVLREPYLWQAASLSYKHKTSNILHHHSLLANFLSTWDYSSHLYFARQEDYLTPSFYLDKTNELLSTLMNHLKSQPIRLQFKDASLEANWQPGKVKEPELLQLITKIKSALRCLISTFTYLCKSKVWLQRQLPSAWRDCSLEHLWALAVHVWSQLDLLIGIFNTTLSPSVTKPWNLEKAIAIDLNSALM